MTAIIIALSTSAVTACAVLAWRMGRSKAKRPQRMEAFTMEEGYKSTNELMKGIIQ